MKKIKSIKIINNGSPPDIDVDILSRGKEEVFKYVSEKYGENNVAKVITEGEFKAKNSFQSICQIHPSITSYERNSLSKMLPDNVSLKELYNKESSHYSEGDSFRASIGDNKLLQEVVQDAALLDGNIRQTGVHACAVIISNTKLTDTIPMIKTDNEPLTQWEYPTCESLGLLKMDFLGLSTLDVIKDCIEFIKYTKGIELSMIDIVNSNLDDKKTYELFQNAETTGIFQLKSKGVRDMLKALKPTNIHDVAAVTALYRPGPMSIGLHEEYSIRKNNKSTRIPIHKDFYNTEVERILKPTLNSMCYQEQIMEISKSCAGFSPKKADSLRKAIGKKNMDIMMSLENDFIKGMLDNGYKENSARILWESILGFGEYAFNKSHSYSYALTFYVTAFLKANYPVEFITSAFKNKSEDKKDEVSAIISDAYRLGIKILSPNINESTLDTRPTLDGKNIVYGLNSLKGIQGSILESIIKERDANGIYKNFEDFMERNVNHVKSGTLKNLAKAGCFDCFGLSRKEIVDNSNTIIKKTLKNIQTKNSLSLFSDIKETLVEKDKEDYPFIEKIKNEYKITAVYTENHPIKHFNPENIDLNLLSEPCKLILTCSKVEIKKSKGGNTGYLLKLNNIFSERDMRLNSELARRVTKKALLDKYKDNLKLAKELFKPFETKDETFENIKPLELPIEHQPYEFYFDVKSWENKKTGKKQEFFYILDYKKIEVDNEGKRMYIEYVPSKYMKKIVKDKEVFSDNGTNTLKLVNNKNNEDFIYIRNIDFKPASFKNYLKSLLNDI